MNFLSEAQHRREAITRILKAVEWETISTILTLAVAYIFTHNFTITLKIVVVIWVVKSIILSMWMKYRL